jgi:demethylmenaquinone methyltransferase/2-methoxy-6-polyprenyl-1,4-benzoquinol methylase
MASSYYIPGEQRAAKVRQLFAAIAGRYDFLNDLQSLGLHRRWKRRMVRMSGARPGTRALDVCCGTGDIALMLARVGARVTGLDFSGAMLAVARRRLEKEAVRPPVEFIEGDAMKLPFADNTFDVVTVAYGLRNLADWEAGLREMQRVAAPGGRLVVLDFGKPSNPLWRLLYFTYLRLVVPLLGRVFCGDADAYGYILESLRHYPAQAGLHAKMSETGLENVQTTNLLGGIMSLTQAAKPGSNSHHGPVPA